MGTFIEKPIQPDNNKIIIMIDMNYIKLKYPILNKTHKINQIFVEHLLILLLSEIYKVRYERQSLLKNLIKLNH